MATQDNREHEFKDNFEKIYLSYYPGMVRFARRYVYRMEDAENIVQDTFAEIWEHKTIYFYDRQHLLSLIFNIIKNKSIEYLRHQLVVKEVHNAVQEEFLLEQKIKFDSLEALDDQISASGETIEDVLRRAIDALPEKCREIFIKNKIEKKKQRDIAAELNISINTVETQMEIAWKKLKQELKDYLPLLLFLVCL
ncbi:MAG: RNA polymerase sigma-70 factor [Tannerella sp.]|jgi:RNA polymerase sigma-70 factor (ECF subfamily)|nr:RNA polymerase sigma-70 factor [Tannerella sp.]